MKKLFSLLLLLYALTSAGMLRACNWCMPDAEIPQLKKFSDDERKSHAQSSVIAQWQTRMALGEEQKNMDPSLRWEDDGGVHGNDGDEVDMDPSLRWEDGDDDSDVHHPLLERGSSTLLPPHLTFKKWHTNEPKSRFYTDYLKNYYPRADAIARVLAPTMCANAFRDMIEAMTFIMYRDMRTRYFVPVGTKLVIQQVHLKILLRQLDTLVSLLKRAEYQVDGDLITFTNKRAAHPRKSLVAQWRSRGITVADDFYALYLDSIITLCYLSIKFHYLKGGFADIYAYCRKLTENVSLLNGTKYEQLYAQKLTLYRQLMKRVQVKLWSK